MSQCQEGPGLGEDGRKVVRTALYFISFIFCLFVWGGGQLFNLKGNLAHKFMDVYFLCLLNGNTG